MQVSRTEAILLLTCRPAVRPVYQAKKPATAATASPTMAAVRSPVGELEADLQKREIYYQTCKYCTNLLAPDRHLQHIQIVSPFGAAEGPVITEPLTDGDLLKVYVPPHMGD